MRFPSFLLALFLWLSEMNVLPSLTGQGISFGLAFCYPHVRARP